MIAYLCGVVTGLAATIALWVVCTLDERARERRFEEWLKDQERQDQRFDT